MAADRGAWRRLKSGEIKATTLNEPFNQPGRVSKAFNPMIDLVPEQIPWLFSGITVQARVAREPPRCIDAISQGHRRGQLPGPQRRESGRREILAKELKITDPRIIDISYDDFQATVAARSGTIPAGRGKTFWLSSRAAAARWTITSIAAFSTGSRRRWFFAQMQRKYGKR